jgi:ABC-2 type transport system permease protein
MKISQIFKQSNLSLTRELVTSDFKLRYQGSVLGYVWSLLKPLMMFGVLYIVFTKLVRLGGNVPFYASYLLLGLVIWQFFVEATVGGMNAITGRGDMVRKVNVPKYVIVISTTLSALVNFCLNLVVVLIFMLFQHVPFRDSLLLVPLVIGELVVFCLAISFLTSALFVKFRDLSHIWDVFLQILFYSTPIIYIFSIVPEKYAKILSLNPLAQIIQDLRAFIITPDTLTTKEVFNSQLLGRVLPVCFILVLSVISAWYFKKSAGKFAEEL